MKAAVIGGTGFIGSHIVDRLVRDGHDVTIFDTVSPGRSDVRFATLDIRDTGATCMALAGDYDAYFLLAAMANVNYCFKNPVENYQANVMGVVNVMEAARRLGTQARVILSSTVWVCGMSSKQEVDEMTEIGPHNATHVYTASKGAAEMVCHSYHKLYGTPMTVLRYGIPYGPRGRAGTVVAEFVRRALAGQPLTMQGDGSQSRKFIYIDDIVEGNILAATKPVATGKTYILDGMESVTIKQIAELIKAEVGNVEIQFQPARAGDYPPKETRTDLAQRELGWRPRVPFKEGLRRYIQWFKGQLGKR
ncbi:MAG: NAD-dependent epimerase/dehydratase family protein [Halobacteria archaeon]